MAEKWVRTLNLSNGLSLRLFDGSRKIAEGRFMVSIIGRMHIPVDPETVDEKQLNASLDEVKRALGDVLVFEKRMDRNFIDAAEKEKVAHEMGRSLQKTLLPYLSHEQFASRYVNISYRKAVERQKWYRSG